MDQTGDGCTVEQTLAALVSMPGISPALGFPEETPPCDIRTGALMLGNMKDYLSITAGPCAQTALGLRDNGSFAEGTGSSVYGPGLNAASVTRISGISGDV